MRAILSSSHFTDEEVEAQRDEAIPRKWKSHSGSRAHELYSILRVSSYRYLEVVEILSLKLSTLCCQNILGSKKFKVYFSFFLLELSFKGSCIPQFNFMQTQYNMRSRSRMNTSDNTCLFHTTEDSFGSLCSIR